MRISKGDQKEQSLLTSKTGEQRSPGELEKEKRIGRIKKSSKIKEEEKKMKMNTRSPSKNSQFPNPILENSAMKILQ